MFNNYAFFVCLVVSGSLAFGLVQAQQEGTQQEGTQQEGTQQEGTQQEGTQQEVLSSEAGLRLRVKARWDALIERDFEKAYSYMSPGYRRLFTLDKYQSSFGSVVSWESVTITDIDLKGKNSADVKVDVFYQLAIPSQVGGSLGEALGSISTQVNETWLWADDEWWYVVLNDSKGV